MKMRPSNPARLLRRCTGLVLLAVLTLALTSAPALYAQSLDPMPPEIVAPAAPASQTPAATQATAPDAAQAPRAAESTSIAPRPIAIVALDSKIPGAAAEVTGGMQVFNGRAFIAANGTITSGAQTTQVTLPYRGTLRICASTTVKLAADSGVPAGEVPGLMMAMDHGAVEASFATGRNSDVLLTPDFRILIGGPGAAEVKVRLGEGGDTCVDNAGADAPYVLVSSVFDSGVYRVQPGQRVMFQHGSLSEVVDQEKEPCGCPPGSISGNEFPLAQSEGLAPTLHPAPIPAGPVGEAAQTSAPLVYNAADHAPVAPAPVAAAAPANPPAAVPAPQKKPGFFKRVGGFFKRIFGGE